MNAPTRILLLLALALTVTQRMLLASPDPEDHRLIVPVVMNQLPKGQFFVILRGDDILISVTDLEAAGLAGFDGTRELIDGREYVSLESMSDQVGFELDPETFVLLIDASPSLLGTERILLMGGPPAGLQYSSDLSAFVNYAVNVADFDRIGVFGELGMSLGGKLLYSTFSRRPDGEILRGFTNLTLDRNESMQRWTLGDAAASTDLIGGNVVVGGVSVAKNFSLQPYFIRYPSFDFSGVASTPSSVEVYVNGILMERREVAPGEFQLENLPLTAGRGDSRIVVRDAFGRETSHESSYYASTRLLDPGLSEYNYSLGFRRDEFASTNLGYDEPVFVGYHRYGLSDSITLGGRLEASENLVSGGPILGILLPAGEIELTLAASGGDGESGTAGSISYRYLSRRGSFGLTLRGLSDGYANLSLEPHQDRRSLEYEVFGGLQLGRASVSTRMSMAEMIDGTETSRAHVVGNLQVMRNASLSLSAGLSRQGGISSNELVVGVSFHFGHRASATVGVASMGDERTQTIEVQRPLPVGEGYGYRIQSRTGDPGETGAASAQVQTSFGRYEVAFDPYDPSRSSSISASGGLVWIGNTLFPSRPVQDSFAVARVGVPDVRVYASNLEIGRTDSNGNLLIPNLLSYYGNRIGIEDRDVPFDYEVGTVEKLVAPPYRGGALIEFPVRRIQMVTGVIVIAEPAGDLIPAYGQLTVDRDGELLVSPVGGAGEFYFENLTAGKHTATIEAGARRCVMQLDIPRSDDQIIDLGTLRCGDKR